jgi:hypothetical protein
MCIRWPKKDKDCVNTCALMPCGFRVGILVKLPRQVGMWFSYVGNCICKAFGTLDES